jgi:hypothetical protein
VAFLGKMLRDHDRRLADCTDPPARRSTPERRLHLRARGREPRQGDRQRRGLVRALVRQRRAVVFKVPRRIWYDMITRVCTRIRARHGA